MFDAAVPVVVGVDDAGVPSCAPWTDVMGQSFCCVDGGPENLSANLPGTWIGTARAPGAGSFDVYQVAFIFTPDGHYSAATGHTGGPFWTGNVVECPLLEQWRVDGGVATDIQLDLPLYHGPGYGCDLDPCEGDLQWTLLAGDGNRLQFYFNRVCPGGAGSIGPTIFFDLWRLCPTTGPG
jgi:hypothetical protein